LATIERRNHSPEFADYHPRQAFGTIKFQFTPFTKEPRMQHQLSRRRRHLPLRWLTILVAVAVSTALLALPAAAGPPVHYPIEIIDNPGTLPAGSVCSFEINFLASATGMGTNFFDNSGTLVRSQWHAVEQDTFTANGNTLVSLPYTYNGRVLFDSNGNVTDYYSSGAILRIRLPDGSLFNSSGRTDWLAHPGATMILAPDQGHSGNLDDFCAALAP
jgi:hypothetical protein